VDIFEILISLIVGLTAGFMAAITAGAGLVTIPVLIFLGVPTNSAIATNSMATLGMFASSLPRYYEAKRVKMRTGLKLIPLAIIGAIIGANVLVRVDAEALTVVVGILLLLLVPAVLLNHEKGLKAFKADREEVFSGYFLYFLIMIYGALLGAGAGIFAMYTLVYFLGMTYLQAKATVSVPGIFLNATAFIIFYWNGLINFELGIPMTIGMYIGGAIGAKTALEKGDAWVKILFVAVIAAAGIKLRFF